MRNQDRTEVVTEVVFLGSLMEQVMAGKIRLPEFQRPFVWKQQDVHNLLDSVFRGYPIGSILVWETNADMNSASQFGPIKIPQSPSDLPRVDYVLDGQQRLSTLFGTLYLKDPSSDLNNQIDWNIYFDLDKREFIRKPRSGATAQHFPVNCLLNTEEFFKAARSIEKIDDGLLRRQRFNEVEELAKAFRDYKLPLIRTLVPSIVGAVEIFARLNRRGRKISQDQMVSALTYRESEFNLASKLDDCQDELARKGFGDLNRVFLLRSVLASLGQDIYAKDWASLVIRQDIQSSLPECFESAKEGINLALNFLENLGVISDQLLPYGLQLVLIGEFFRKCSNPSPETKALLERWFWVTSFTGWFGNVGSTQSSRALKEIRQIAENKISEFREVNLDEPALPFPKRFDGKSARTRAFLLYLTSLKPLSLRKQYQDEIDIRLLFSSLKSRALGFVHHNPKEHLFSSIPANRMYMDDDLTGDICEGLSSLSYDQLHIRLPTHGIMEQSIPESIEALCIGNYKKFIRIRQNDLIEGERKFMKKRNVSLPVVRMDYSISDSDTTD